MEILILAISMEGKLVATLKYVVSYIQELFSCY